MRRDGGLWALGVCRVEALVREWSPGSLLNSPFSNGEMQGKTAWDVDEWKSITDQIQVVAFLLVWRPRLSHRV